MGAARLGVEIQSRRSVRRIESTRFLQLIHGTMNQTTFLRRSVAVVMGSVALSACSDLEPTRVSAPSAAVVSDDVDAALRAYLAQHGFTGRIASTLETRLGRRIDHQLA